jgi:uncharacterized protein involved in exopolysaccharide biosynthesis
MAEIYTSKTLREMTRIIASRFGGMVLLFVIVAAAVVAVTFLSPKWYRSEATLLTRPGVVGNPLEEQASPFLRDRISLFVVTQREIIMSNYVLASALMRMKGEAIAQGGEPNSSSSLPVQWYEDSRIKDFVAHNGKLLARIRNRVKVVTPGGSDSTFTQTFKIRVDWSQRDADIFMPQATPEQTAQQVAKLAGCVRDAYLMRYTYLESLRAMEAAKLFQQQSLTLANAALDEASSALNRFIDSELKGDLLQVINMIGAGGAGVETGSASLATQFTATINKIDQRLAEVTALKTAVDAELVKSKPAAMVVPDAITASNPQISKLQSRIIELKLQLNSLEPRYTPDFQQVKTAKAELEAAQGDLQAEFSKQSSRLGQEIATLTAQRTTLSAKVSEDRRRMDELAGKVSRYQRLLKAADSAQEIYDDEQKRVVGAITAEKLAAKPVLVTSIDEPNAPDPSAPRLPIVWLNLLIGVVAGVVLAMVYAFLADHFDHSIKSIDGAERYLGMPVLASIPRLGRRIIVRAK